MPADYQILETNGSFPGSNPPYLKLFVASQTANTSPMLMLWVKTAYTTWANSASVRINGTEVDRIGPRPWEAGLINIEAISMPFSSTLLNVLPGYPWLPMINQLTIVPATTADFVYIDNMILLSRS